MKQLALLVFLAACSSSTRTTTTDGGVVPTDGSSTKPSDSGSSTDAASSTDLAVATSEAIQIIVEPSDHAQALIDAINGAQTSVHMTMYLLSNDTITTALINRHKAGVDVKIVLNQTFPSSSTSNQDVYTQLKNAGVSVVWAPSTFMYTHEKCVIIDGATAWIMTMNATGTSPTDNREYLAIDTQSADVAEAEAIFAADYADTTWSPSGSLLVSPINSRDRLVALLGTATSTVDLEVEELSDSKIVAALTAQADASRTVHVTLSNETPSSSQSSAVTTLKQHGVKVVSTATPYIHAKAIVIDGKTAFVGSENFTTGSLEYNRELGVTFSTASEVGKVLTGIQTDYAAGTAL